MIKDLVALSPLWEKEHAREKMQDTRDNLVTSFIVSKGMLSNRSDKRKIKDGKWKVENQKGRII